MQHLANVLVSTNLLDLSPLNCYDGAQLSSQVECSLQKNLWERVQESKHSNSDDSRLPLTTMPMGLIEHCINFFTSSYLQQVIFQAGYLHFINYFLLLYIGSSIAQMTTESG